MKGLRFYITLVSLFITFSCCLTQVESAFGIKLEVNDETKNDNDVDSSNANRAGNGSPPVLESNNKDAVDVPGVSDDNSGATGGSAVENNENGSTSSASNSSISEQAPQDEMTTANNENEAMESNEAASSAASETTETAKDSTAQEGQTEQQEETPVVQSGPFIDLLGDTLLSLEMVDQTHARINTHYTNDVIKGKKVIGLYFSADWCNPCRQFTPELVSFYDKINKRKNDSFEIIWVSRCRDVKSFGQYFTHMKWLALPPEEALGARGQMLSEKFKVKGIPHLVLLDELGSVITYSAREMLPKDKAGIGFPWRSPLATLYVTFIPKPLRYIMKSYVEEVKSKIDNILGKLVKK